MTRPDRLLSVAAIILVSILGCESPAAPSPELEGGVVATFDVSGERFSAFITDETAIDRLIRIRNGADIGQIPNGRILRGPGAGGHNAPHPWHLDPEDIQIVDAAIEVCDGRPSFVDANVGYFVDVVGRYCPWGARLVRLDDYR